jgi:hypothetical protein
MAQKCRFSQVNAEIIAAQKKVMVLEALKQARKTPLFLQRHL